MGPHNQSGDFACSREIYVISVGASVSRETASILGVELRDFRDYIFPWEPRGYGRAHVFRPRPRVRVGPCSVGARDSVVPAVSGRLRLTGRVISPWAVVVRPVVSVGNVVSEVEPQPFR